MTRQLSVPSLPPEITDYIIDHCHSDKDALSTCGMVSKSWYSASRYHLFSAVEVSQVEGKGFYDLLHTSRLLGVTVTSYIQELSFHLKAGDTEGWLADLSSVLPEYVPLRTLRIFCHGVHLSEEIKQMFTATFRSITHLALFESTLRRRSLADDVKFICSFQNLESILFYGHHRHDMDIPLDFQLPSRVRTLKLDLPGPGTEAFIQWLLTHENGIPLVPVLHVFRITNDTNPALQAYLRACKHELQDLMLFLYQYRADLADFDFSEHTALKNLYLNFNGTSTTRTAHEVLSTLRSCDLENLIMRISVYELIEIEDWAPVDSLLASVCPAARVTVAVDEHGEYQDRMRARLPSCDQRGQLDVVRAGTPSIANDYVEEVYERMKAF
ncbi:hypothetical protein V5O48_016341 [Marasmius crinis-equi]|uniref:F-box domain-containing protein n=1 Tax=Marasmius crinis-equi TaxID=585013 RepID=A0ABR3ERZ3_9AGAR